MISRPSFWREGLCLRGGLVVIPGSVVFSGEDSNLFSGSLQ
jgi:hypothetical protein